MYTYIYINRAENTHSDQVFYLKNREWVRYLKVRFLTHYGKEYVLLSTQQ
jgi:hypothetical protein